MAFHRSVYQLDGIKHFCEPFVLPHYFGAERRSIQFADNQEAKARFEPIPTYADRLEDITKDYTGYHTNFIKEHALYVWPGIVPDSVLRGSVHTFQIRNPEKAIKSLYRQTLEPFEESSWSHFVPEELGFKEQLLLFRYVTTDLGLPAIVIDADDLLRNPREILQEYCKFVGLRYDDRMLDWSTDGEKTEPKPWDFLPNSWIKDVRETTGFRRKEKTHNDDIEYPQVVFDAINDNVKYYDELLEHRMQCPGS